MIDQEKVPVTFLSGFSSRKGLLSVLAIPDALSGENIFCWLFTYFNRKWTWVPKNFDFDCKSLTLLGLSGEAHRAWWLLGKNGEVVELVGGDKPIIQKITGAGLGVNNSYGYVNTLKNIAETLYVCGYGRQVYRYSADKWVSISDDILTRDIGRGFFDIDGIDEENIYAVGWHGEVYFYNGQRWRKDSDITTTVHLASVRCLSPEDIWICGNHGIVLHGHFNQWNVIKNEKLTDNWFCIEEHNGRVYVAGNNSIAYIDGDTIIPINIALDRVITTHKLHSRDGLLWSIGEKDIFVFNGTSWEEVIFPENV